MGTKISPKQNAIEDAHLFPTGLKPKAHLLSDMVQEFGWLKQHPDFGLLFQKSKAQVWRIRHEICGE